VLALTTRLPALSIGLEALRRSLDPSGLGMGARVPGGD
jgi:hypothetical protein